MTVLNYAAGPGYRDSYHNLTLRNTGKAFSFRTLNYRKFLNLKNVKTEELYRDKNDA